MAKVLLYICILLGVVGQVLLKKGINEVAIAHPPLFNLIIQSLLNPPVIAGFLLYGISAILWIIVLSRVDLSVAYPTISVGYVLILLFSWFYLKEPLNWGRVVGVLLISAGVILLGWKPTLHKP